jgi:hypothetical protein
MFYFVLDNTNIGGLTILEIFFHITLGRIEWKISKMSCVRRFAWERKLLAGCESLGCTI